MQLNFSPVRADQPISLEKSGGALIVNGQLFDFSPLAEGALLPQEAVDGDWLASDVLRVEGTLQMTVYLPHGADAPAETLFPQSLEITQDGPVTLPPYNSAKEL